jgi:hypothetical protein
MIRKMLAAAALVALMIGTANAEPKTKLPKAFLGEWCFDTKTETYRRARCRQSDGWLNVRPGGFSAHETDCTLQSASPNRSGEYRTQFECRGEGMIWTTYYWIGLDARDPRRLFLNETDSTFTKTEPDPSERNERLEDGTGSPARLPDEVLGDWCPMRDPRCAVTDPMAIRSSGTMTTFDGDGNRGIVGRCQVND